MSLSLVACKSDLQDKPKVYCSMAAPQVLVNGVSAGPTLALNAPARISLGTPTCSPTGDDAFWVKPDGTVVHNTCLDVTPTQTGQLKFTFYEYVAFCEETVSYPAEFAVQ